ncbi:rhomboid family intramembrane serine protease [Mycoplasma sp. P36-A1]|uniref:rhomboid family intramembrane serine protease n=1 Tax=Mycoplasma sp. P36-A1 TaxID=3252900 RepID=UPI003C2F8974
MERNNKFIIIIALNIVVYAIMMMASSSYAASGVSQSQYTYLTLGAYGPFVLGENQWYRIITYAFAHADLIHLGMNMLALYSLADPVIRFTSEKFAIIAYFIAAIVSGLGVTFFTDTIVIGASGAVYGLFGILLYYAYKLSKQGYNDLLRAYGPVILINVLISLTPGVSLAGHFFGLLAGVVSAYVYDKKIRRNYWR